MATAAIVLVAVIIVVPLVWSFLPSSPRPSVPNFPVVSATLGGANGSAESLYPEFLGVNVRADVSLSSASLSALDATGVRFLRWPGGGNGDRLDPLANGGVGEIYSDSGSAAASATSLAEFTAGCRALSCDALMTLPAEIDDPAYAAAIVNYTEVGLGFVPAYWEIGNEPALWTHFGVPWDRWNASQDLAPTPAEYATLVGAYVRAIRSVDPVTPIVGIGGVGGSQTSASTWETDTIAANGPNLSAIAIHVYPAGPGFPSNAIPQWFATLDGRSAIPYRAETTLALLNRTCPTCHLGLLIDEFQTGSLLAPADSLSGGYLAAYIAAEVVQSLSFPLVSLDYYNFQSGTPGAWLGPGGAPSAGYAFYQALGQYLGTVAEPVNVSAADSGLLAAEGGSSASAIDGLLLVNTNASVGFRLNLSLRFPQAANATAWVFDGAAASPFTLSVGVQEAGNWTVPPASVVLFSGIGAPIPP